MPLGVPPEDVTENPFIKYQLLYNVAELDDNCFMTAKWTEAELDDWERSGYRTQDGHFTEVGLYNSEAELEKAKKEIMESRNKQYPQ